MSKWIPIFILAYVFLGGESYSPDPMKLSKPITPETIKTWIVDESERQNLPYDFVMAIAEGESSYNHNVVNLSGEQSYGAFQLNIPWQFEDCKKRTGIEWPGTIRHNPKINVKCGVGHIADLFKVVETKLGYSYKEAPNWYSDKYFLSLVACAYNGGIDELQVSKRGKIICANDQARFYAQDKINRVKRLRGIK